MKDVTGKPAFRYAEFAVNLVGSMAIFLISSYDPRKKNDL